MNQQDKNNLLQKTVAFFEKNTPSSEGYCVCIGSAAMDFNAYPIRTLNLYDSNPGRVFWSAGGVCSNVARNLAKLGICTKMISRIGNDPAGERLLSEINKAGVDVSSISRTKDFGTATYVALLDKDRNLHAGIADMQVIEYISPNDLNLHYDLLQNSKCIFCDANLSEESISWLIKHYHHLPIFVDPVSTSKGMRVKDHLRGIHTLKPNLYEAAAMSGFSLNDPELVDKSAEWFLQQGVKNIFMSLEQNGMLAACEAKRIQVSIIEAERILSMSGAGDACMAGLIYAHLAGADIDTSTCFALAMATLTIESIETVSDKMNLERLLRIMKRS